MKIMHLLSGGLDSVTMLYLLREQGHKIKCLLFNYAQAHGKELVYAKWHANKLKLKYAEVELFRITGLFGRCALTAGKGDIVVPNRNAIFLNIAASMAMSEKYEAVGIACNRDDAAQFSDCTSRFLGQQRVIWEDMGIGVSLLAPFSSWSKSEIAKESKRLGIDPDDTWSCYKGDVKPCGKCLACKLRSRALK